MNLLQLFFIINWFMFILIWYEFFKNRKLTIFQIFILVLSGVMLVIFTVYPISLHYFWKLFWISRWSYVLIYLSIIFLLYMLINVLSKIELNQLDLTTLIRNLSIENSIKKRIYWREVFIIPAHNEQDVIEQTIQELLDYWYKNIILINDWSTDNTRRILEEKFIDKIVLLNHLKNRGQWAALETWFEYVRKYGDIDYVITYDSDGQHDLKDLQNFFQAFEKDSSLQVVLGSRFIENKSNIPFLRKLILIGWKIFTLVISWKYFSDVHNWYRVFKKSALDRIKINIDGMAHASEIQDIIARKKIKFKEVPVNIKYTKYSLAKWQKWWNAINIALKMLWLKLFKH